MNKVLLIGNLATDPEMRTTQSGISTVSFRIAVQRKYTNANGEREADFLTCVAWRQTAEFIHKYFIKGNKIALEGALQARSYEAQDGSKRYVTEIVVESAEFVAPKAQDAPQGAQKPAQPAQKPVQTRMDTSGYVEVDPDDLPF